MSRSERLEARLEELEQEVLNLASLLKQAIDANRDLATSLGGEISRLSQNEQILAQALEEQDNTLVAIRISLENAKVLDSKSFFDKLNEVRQMRQRAAENRQQQAELEAVQRKAAEAAKIQAGHPPEAFIFGG
jgi:hypothetical protein